MKPSQPDISVVMNTTPGRRWMWEHLQSCGLLGPAFHQDPYINAYNQGKRDVALALQSQILSTDFEAYMLMLNENAKSSVDSV